MPLEAEFEFGILDTEPAPQYYVHLFLVTREYGGPEEGGWWYNHGNPATNVGHGSVGPFDIARDAYEVSGHLQAFTEVELNAGEPPLSSVMSAGRYEWHVTQDREPHAYPEHRPHYE